MKKILAYTLAFCLTLGFTGCGQDQAVQPPASQPDDLSNNGTPAPTESALVHAIVLPSVKETVNADDGTPLFSLSFQQPQLLLQDTALEEKITADLLDRKGAVLADAELFEAQARQDYPETEFWSEYFISSSYTPTRLDQTVLSLCENSVIYCGGAHPSMATVSVTYSLKTGNVLFLDDILVPEFESDALYELILERLAPQEEELYADYQDALSDRFANGLNSIQNWYFSGSGLCFHFSPYDIAPYASGTILAELTYDSLIGILKDEYFPAETQATGSMYVQTTPEQDNGHFTYIVEAVLQEDGSEVLLYPDAAVTDLRIETGIRDSEQDRFIANATVFAASTMNVGDAIRLTADLDDVNNVLRLVYRSDNQEYSVYITYDADTASAALSNI